MPDVNFLSVFLSAPPLGALPLLGFDTREACFLEWMALGVAAFEDCLMVPWAIVQ